MLLSELPRDIVDILVSFLDGESILKLIWSGDLGLKRRLENCSRLDLQFPACLGDFPLCVLQGCSNLLQLRLGYMRYAKHCRLRNFDSKLLPQTLQSLDLRGVDVLSAFKAPMSEL